MKKNKNLTSIVPASAQPYTIALPTAKQMVKTSVIAVNKATLTLSQNGIDLFTRSTEGLSLSESYAALSNIFHYQLKGKKVRLDKFNPLTLRLLFGETLYEVTMKARINKKGEYVPYTSGSVSSLLKTLYHNFAADILEAVTMQGHYFNYVHAANSIANFTRMPEAKPKAAKV